jgi:quinol monooxygenase YgiN
MEYNQIHFRAEFTIEEGKIEEYKKLIQSMSRVVEASEPDTVNYQFYLNRDETKCIVHETYSRRYLPTLPALHHKQYFQRFSVSLG